MIVQAPPPSPRRTFYSIRAYGFPKRRRVTPTQVRAICWTWVEMAKMVLWLEAELGYHCKVFYHNPDLDLARLKRNSKGN